MNNKGNIAPTQKFNPPTQHEVYMEGKFVGLCRVYDPAAWRNKNRHDSGKTGESKPRPVAKIA